MVLDRRRHRVTIHHLGACCRLRHQTKIIKIENGQEKLYELRYGAEPIPPAGPRGTAAVGGGRRLRAGTAAVLCEKLLIISQRSFGIPPFRFSALADGIRTILSRCTPSPPADPLKNLQLEQLVGVSES